MATSILDRYGIKEVADVTFYKLDTNGNKTFPVLYLDTLKVSTIEQTAENTSARGGKGNPELIVWDYGKEITVTLEDALFSMKSMAIMYGAVDNSKNPQVVTDTTKLETIYKTLPKSVIVGKGSEADTQFTVDIGGKSLTVAASSISWYAEDGITNSTVNIGSAAYGTFVVPVKDAQQIEISAATFPGNYYVTGDTYARNEKNGEDEFFQFIIPKAKVMSEVTLTMEAEGDPSTFSMNLRVLRPEDGKMMKLVKYDINTGSNG